MASSETGPTSIRVNVALEDRSLLFEREFARRAGASSPVKHFVEQVNCYLKIRFSVDHHLPP